MQKLRPPVVTVLGHVDHGKTSILDALRSSSVQAREAGGITQGTSASTIKTSEGSITFVDTPGHSAFSKMRERGSRIADIALLVVAADDGVKPQTEEALSYIKEVNMPYIVVFNKIDLPSADVSKVQGELMEREVLFEGLGGDVPHVSVSAKKNEGLNELIEMINLIAQVNEISGDAEGDLEGVILESDKGKMGITVCLVIKNGTLKKGDEIVSDGKDARVKGIFDENGKPVNEILPGYGGTVLGFSELPEVGSSVFKKGKEVQRVKGSSEKKNIDEVGEEQVGVVIKASTAGKLEAILNSLPGDAIVISSGVGDITDNDIFMAKSGDSQVLGFEVKISSSIKKLADTEGVTLKNFRIIYELIDYVAELIDDKTKKYSGKAEILAKFPFNNKQVAGSKILEGEMKLNDKVSVVRGEKEIGIAKITSLKRGKEDIDLAKAGEECGILLTGQLDFEVGDVLLSDT